MSKVGYQKLMLSPPTEPQAIRIADSTGLLRRGIPAEFIPHVFSTLPYLGLAHYVYFQKFHAEDAEVRRTRRNAEKRTLCELRELCVSA